MKVQVQLSAGIESLFGTRDENMRLIEEGLDVRTRVTNDSIEIEGEDTNVLRAEVFCWITLSCCVRGLSFRTGI